MQHGSSVARSIKPRDCLGMRVGAIGACIVLGNRPLIFRKHIDAETLFRMQMGVRAGVAAGAQ